MGSPAGSTAVFRIGTDPPDVVELWDWSLQPGDAFDGEAHPVGTVEVLSVLSGTLTLRVGDAELARGRRHRDVRGPRPASLRLRGAGHGALHDGRLDPGVADLVPPTSIAPASPE